MRLAQNVGMSRNAALLACVMSLAACYSYRRGVPLDAGERAEIASIATRFAGRDVLVTTDPRGAVATALAAHGWPVVADMAAGAPILVSIDGAHMEVCDMSATMMPLLTLGIVPDVGRRRREYYVDVKVGEREARRSSHDVGMPYVFGWIASPIALFPGWSLALTPVKDGSDLALEPERLALLVARDIAAAIGAE
jgi:hypothetical protein